MAGIAILVGLYFYKSKVVVAWVNGRPVWRCSLNKEMESQIGQQVLDSLVTKQLILQAASKQKVKVKKEEIDESLETIRANLDSQGQELEAVLELQGISLNELKEQIKLQKLVDKLVGTESEVSEEEISQYITENREILPNDLTAEELNQRVKEQIKQQKLNQEVQDWLRGLQEEAKVVSWL